MDEILMLKKTVLSLNDKKDTIYQKSYNQSYLYMIFRIQAT